MELEAPNLGDNGLAGMFQGHNWGCCLIVTAFDLYK